MPRRYLLPESEQDNSSNSPNHITVMNFSRSHSEHSNKRASSYTDVASMKLKQDVESSRKQSTTCFLQCGRKKKEVTMNPPRPHSWHSLFPSFTSSKRPTRRFSVVLQLRSQPHPCGFEVVLYGCSPGTREAV